MAASCSVKPHWLVVNDVMYVVIMRCVVITITVTITVIMIVLLMAEYYNDCEFAGL